MSEGSGGSGAAGADSDYVTLRPGHVVGRYRIVSVLGQGGFGITYRASDSELGREVAIKEYLPAALAIRQDGVTVLPRSRNAADDFAWGRDRFVAEGRTLAALHRAPGIVRVHDFLEANGTAYLVMELLAGETLHDRVARQGPLDAQAIDRILGPLLDGLEQVHAAGFLHRDIKPANILLDDEGRPTLIDFGASRTAIAGRSQMMTAVFTPGYAPVEQFTSAPQGPWTDIYGLAATLHHAVTGEAPPNSIDRMLDDAYVPLAGSDRPYPRELLAGIDAGLAVRAAERPQSIAQWRSRLVQSGPAAPSQATVVMRDAAPGATVAAATATAPARSRGPALLAAIAVGLPVVLGGVWFAFMPRSPGPPPVATAAVPSAQDRVQEELEQARREQKAAQDEAARLREEAEARHKADEEAALRRKIEDEVRQKAEAEEAARRQAADEARRQADADAAAQRQAEADAKSKAEAEAEERRKAEEADRKGAEAAEAALRLGQADRQRLQVALSALGFGTAGADGVFGPRSREMIAAWQKKTGRAATGYVSADTQAALLREAAPALARYDEEQKKLAEPQAAPVARPGATATPAAGQDQAAAPKGAGQCEGTWRSQWCRAAFQGFPPYCWNATMTIRNGEIADSWVSSEGQRNVVTGRIDATGNVRITYDGVGQQTHVDRRFIAPMSGRVADGVLTAAGRAGANGRDFTVRVQCR